LHSKLIVTDKHILVGSINLNKMNLGFNITKKYWRENTETFYLSDSEGIIQDAKEKFEKQIQNSVLMQFKLAKKIQQEVSNIINKSFKLRATKEVKKLFSIFILNSEIEVKKNANKIIKISKKLMHHYSSKIIDKDLFIMAIVLYYLQDRKHTLSEIDNKLNRLDITANLSSLIAKLSDSNFLEMEGVFYKINIEALIE